ncbi:MAG: LysM peptidoglycan-binding domain-containing protein [Verrucomicrobia bacterium]|nr:LysM peptidoglycan-binding domain-containing protein [Deltaproteobacteria bacterium]
MIQCVFGMFIAIVLLVGATPGWSQQYYIYTPKPVAAEEKVRKKDGVLVQEVPVKKGDTLSRISRRFSGRASYFPQILLFNEIKNPDLIYTGTTLRIPVSRSSATGQAPPSPVQSKMKGVPSAGPVPGRSAGNLKKGAAVEGKKRDSKHKAAATTSKHARSAKLPAAVVAATSEQRLFERAIKAYRQDDYRTALELFDRFLADYPASALAADASLYKAECYLKQSNL